MKILYIAQSSVICYFDSYAIFKYNLYFFFYCLCTKLIIHSSHIDISELQIRGGIENNLKMIFLISQENLVL